MKKLMLVIALVCAFINLNAHPYYGIGYAGPQHLRIPPPPHGWRPHIHGSWAEHYAANLVAAMVVSQGVGGYVYAAGSNSVVIQQPVAATPVPLMHTTTMPIATTTVTSAPMPAPAPQAQIYYQPVVQQTTPVVNQTTLVVPQERHPLVGVNVLGLKVGIGY